VAAPEHVEKSTKADEQNSDKDWAGFEPIGFLTLVLGLDNHNQGSVVDTVLTPQNDLREEFNVNAYALPAGIGVKYNQERLSSGWLVDGQLLGAFLIDTKLLLIDSFARIQSPSGALSFALGRYTPGIISPHVPSTWNYAFGWGNLQTLFTGLRVGAEAPIGLFIDAGIGINEPLANRSAIIDAERGSERYPFANARAGWKGSSKGQRFGKEVPSTVTLSAGYGLERVGTNEDDLLMDVAPGARLPVVEDLATWTLSAEAQVAITPKLVMTGEAYLGRNSHLHTGAMFQRSRIDLDTGRHLALHSMGGWMELSAATGAVDLAMIAGGERILSRFDETSLQMRDDVRATYKAALVASIPFGQNLSAGLQADYFATEFDDESLGRTVNLTALAAARLIFR
jgi:hypothetical protein